MEQFGEGGPVAPFQSVGERSDEGFGIESQGNASYASCPNSANVLRRRTEVGPPGHEVRRTAPDRPGAVAGGDARGRMSAALLVVAGSPPAQPGGGNVVATSSRPQCGPAWRPHRSARPRRTHSPTSTERSTSCSEATQPAALAHHRLRRRRAPVFFFFFFGEENLRFVRGRARSPHLGATEAAIAELFSVAERPTWEVIIRRLRRHEGAFAVTDGLSISTILG